METADKDTLIEELLVEHPEANRFFLDIGLRCLQCGEPYWGSVADFLAENHITGQDADRVIAGLNTFLEDASGREGRVVLRGDGDR